MARTIASGKRGTLLDAHVHLHVPANAISDLRQAAASFTAVGNGKNPAVIMLAERAGYDVFRLLESQLASTGEPESLWFEHDGQRLLIVAGRQIVSAEGLEVLGLVTRTQIPDGLPVDQVLARLEEADAIAVLPWGAGKWLGKRGKIVDRLLTKARPGHLFLGDNGGRPGWWQVPQFSTGIPILAGSDPLPLPGSARKIGCYGSLLGAALSDERPATNLKQALRDPATRITTYGRLTPMFRFITDQARLRIGRKSMEQPA